MVVELTFKESFKPQEKMLNSIIHFKTAVRFSVE